MPEEGVVFEGLGREYDGTGNCVFWGAVPP